MRYFCFIVLIILLSGCSSTQKFYEKEQIMGAWQQRNQGQPSLNFSHIGITRNGNLCELNYRFDQRGIMSLNYYLSSYQIKGIHLHSDVVFSSKPRVRVGDSFKDRIATAAENGFELIRTEKNQTKTYQRLTGISAEDICQVIENFRKVSRTKRAPLPIRGGS